MTCPNKLENGQPCGDEGHICDECFDREAARWWAFFGAAKSTHKAFGDFYGWTNERGDQ